MMRSRPVQSNGQHEEVSELRQDLVTRKWYVVAKSRGRRPSDFAEADHRGSDQEYCEHGGDCPDNCPFRDLSNHYNDATLLYYDGSDIDSWRVMSFPNDYPSFFQGQDLHERNEGLFSKMDAIGFHEVIVSRAHCNQIRMMEREELHEFFRSYKERYLALMNRQFVNYILIMLNYGSMAGASLYHPHSQLFALPIISSDLQDELTGAYEYYREHTSCVYCSMVDYERDAGVRVVAENDSFVMICPFMSRTPFEMSIIPKSHASTFETTSMRDLKLCADLLQEGLQRLYHGLQDPPLNYYIHTSPCDGLTYDYYHWHLKIMPRLTKFAGFELGTGIEVNTVPPEDACAFLRSVDISL